MSAHSVRVGGEIQGPLSRGGEILEFRSLRSHYLACFVCQNYLRPLVATSDNRCIPLSVLCSAIFRRVFLALRSPRSLREPLLQLRCHHLALATQLALAQKSTFLKIPISFTSLIPSPILPKDEREMTERTTTQLPANKKCCLLIFAIAIGCLVLADFPASSHPFSFLSAVMLCGVPDNARGVLGCTLRFCPREIPIYKQKIALKAILFAFMQKLLYLCTRKLNAGV